MSKLPIKIIFATDNSSWIVSHCKATWNDTYINPSGVYFVQAIVGRNGKSHASQSEINSTAAKLAITAGYTNSNTTKISSSLRTKFVPHTYDKICCLLFISTEVITSVRYALP